jgi:hypothetical protein
VVVRATGAAPVELAVRRFADGFGATILTATQEGPLRVARHKDRAAGTPYHPQATAGSPLEVCGGAYRPALAYVAASATAARPSGRSTATFAASARRIGTPPATR